MHFTVKGEDPAKRLIKRLFSEGLIAAAEVEKSGFVREYVKVGSVTKDKDSLRLTLTTTDA